MKDATLSPTDVFDDQLSPTEQKDHFFRENENDSDESIQSVNTVVDQAELDELNNTTDTLNTSFRSEISRKISISFSKII